MDSISQFSFRLYVAGDASNSVLALSNLNALCREFLPGRHQIEVVDILHEAGRALSDGILVTPTLVRLAPIPICRIIGNLSARSLVLQTLGLSDSS